MNSEIKMPCAKCGAVATLTVTTGGGGSGPIGQPDATSPYPDRGGDAFPLSLLTTGGINVLGFDEDERCLIVEGPDGKPVLLASRTPRDQLVALRAHLDEILRSMP
jgi:hypothetical protein